MHARHAVWLSAALLLVPSIGHAALTTIRVASGLERPVFMAAPTGDDRLFILEQRGVIRIWKNGAVLARPFLDIDPLVRPLSGEFDERGLLGLAFHPDYAVNGRFYVYYIDNGNDSVLAEYYVSGDPDSAIVDSSRTVITIDQPFGNHNGGTIAFRPTDGYLYVGLGDGGGGGDPNDRAQNPEEFLGKFLRLDVDGSLPYEVPAGNPYVGNPDGLDEIWNLGFRNPYRWSFDRATGDLYAGDVGQGCFEEVSYEPAGAPGGANYGWDVMEGPNCFNESAWDDCDAGPCTGDTLELPIHSFPRTDGRCAVTGGYVYRGSAIPALQGTYFFADFCADSIWSFRNTAGILSEFTDRTAELAPGMGQTITDISAFGEDGYGELYVVDRGSGLGATGEIYKIVDATLLSAEPGRVASGVRLGPPAPNPFLDTTRLELVLERAGTVRVDVLDAAGRRVRQLYNGFAPGRVFIVWDGRGQSGQIVPSGVYFVRARAGDQQTSRRVERIR